MSDPFTLTVPADAAYRVLAPEVAGKYAELSGGTAADGQALAAAVTSAMALVANGAGVGAHLDLAFRPAAGRVDVTVQCGDRSTVVSVPLAAASSR